MSEPNKKLLSALETISGMKLQLTPHTPKAQVAPEAEGIMRAVEEYKREAIAIAEHPAPGSELFDKEELLRSKVRSLVASLVSQRDEALAKLKSPMDEFREAVERRGYTKPSKVEADERIRRASRDFR